MESLPRQCGTSNDLAGYQWLKIASLWLLTGFNGYVRNSTEKKTIDGDCELDVWERELYKYPTNESIVFLCTLASTKGEPKIIYRRDFLADRITSTEIAKHLICTLRDILELTCSYSNMLGAPTYQTIIIRLGFILVVVLKCSFVAVVIDIIHTVLWRSWAFLPIWSRSFDNLFNNPDSKAHGANMGPIWGRQDPGGPHVGPMNFAIWEHIHCAHRGASYIGGLMGILLFNSSQQYAWDIENNQKASFLSTPAKHIKTS